MNPFVDLGDRSVASAPHGPLTGRSRRAAGADEGERPVQSQVCRLRLVLGADASRTTAPGYVLDVDRDAVDLHRFDLLVNATGPRGRDRSLDLDGLDEARTAC